MIKENEIIVIDDIIDDIDDYITNTHLTEELFDEKFLKTIQEQLIECKLIKSKRLMKLEIINNKISKKIDKSFSKPKYMHMRNYLKKIQIKILNITKKNKFLFSFV